jgi:phosphatidylglycerophosphatase A
VAVIGALFLVPAPWWVDALVAVAAIAVSVWAATPFAADDDPGWVCIDEVAGTLVAVVGLSGPAWVVAVVVARFADIFKVLPGVGAAEAMPGAWGVTLDDVVAGLYGLAAGWAITGLT